MVIINNFINKIIIGKFVQVISKQKHPSQLGYFRVCCKNSIFLRLTWELAGKYALIGILCLFRRVRWYVGNQQGYIFGHARFVFPHGLAVLAFGSFTMNKEELVELLAKSQDAILERVDSKLQELKRSIYEGQEECLSSVVKRVKEDHSIKREKVGNEKQFNYNLWLTYFYGKFS